MEPPLAERTLELVDVPSPSRHEEPIARVVAAAVPLPLVHREGATLLFAPEPTGRPLVVLAGHLDTVPAQGNVPGRIDDGWVHGLGASDMKGGVAVMVELACRLADGAAALAYDVAFLFFPREELPPAESALPAVLATGLLDRAELVVVLEPTDNTIQAGCLGNITAELTFEGRSAHSARPWLGENAVAVAVDDLTRIVHLEALPVDVGGLTFREVVTVTGIEGGVAANVVPDRVRCSVNYRYAPDRTPADAEARLRELAVGRGRLSIVGNAPPGRVAVDTPLMRRLREAGPFTVEPKQAWTPVAEFSAHGLDAVNLGPGATRYAHTRDERVAVAELHRTFDALLRFLAA